MTKGKGTGGTYRIDDLLVGHAILRPAQLQSTVLHLIDAEIAVAGGAANVCGRLLRGSLLVLRGSLLVLLGLDERLDAVGAGRVLGVGAVYEGENDESWDRKVHGVRAE